MGQPISNNQQTEVRKVGVLIGLENRDDPSRLWEFDPLRLRQISSLLRSSKAEHPPYKRETMEHYHPEPIQLHYPTVAQE